MKKQFLLSIFLISLLFLTSFASAQNYSVWLHTVDIEINSIGDAQISEKFHLFFPTDEDKLHFRNLSARFGSDIKDWQAFNPNFVPTIGSTNIINGKIAYSEDEANYLELSYGLTDSIMAKGKENSLVAEYNIKANYFNSLYESGLWVIPDNTQINIILPPGAEVKDSIEPSALISRIGQQNIITWNGYKSANQLNVKYVLLRKISPLVDLNDFTNFLFRTNEGLTIILIILVIIAIVSWKRKTIAGKIESFVENNTIIEEE
ncbi:MAG: hypothetical protein HOE11_00300 [Candidatus Diapherotrites archaeon]|jgi:hypothetical protein|nr:hypothetical protein [Candidatus Diapherotrites archaeon]MBT4596586.1 hypothetical protein [Candidatus Diapherotrites archaeon]